MIESYQCGIFDRIDAWYKGLGLKFSVTPQMGKCLMHQGQKCTRTCKFRFPSEEV